LDLKLLPEYARGSELFGPATLRPQGYNLDRVQDWLQSGQAPRGRAERGLRVVGRAFVAVQSVLARRWIGRLVATLAGRPRQLDAAAAISGWCVDDEMRQRLAAFDIHPSGPLWGRGDLLTEGLARGTRWKWPRHSRILPICSLPNLAQERRSLRCAVRDLVVEAESGTITLGFTLGRRAVRHLGAARNM